MAPRYTSTFRPGPDWRPSHNMSPPSYFELEVMRSTPEERSWYSLRVASSDDDRFVQENADFVKRLAMRVKAELDLRCELDDLIGFGFEGLLQAKSRWDGNHESKAAFRTFAYYRVRGSILDGVRKMAYLPAHAHKARKLAEAMDAALEEMGESRAAGEAQGKSPELEATVAAIDDVLGKICASYVIAAVGQDEATKQDNPEGNLVEAQTKDRLLKALDTLPERERIVVRGLYFEDRLLDDIGAQLGISRSWASRIHTRAIGLLKDALAGD